MWGRGARGTGEHGAGGVGVVVKGLGKGSGQGFGEGVLGGEGFGEWGSKVWAGGAEEMRIWG